MKPRIIHPEELEKKDFGPIIVSDFLNDPNYEKFSIAKVIIKGKQKKGYDSKSDIAYYVLDGEGKFVLGDKENSVKKGDLIFIPSGTPYKDDGNLTLLAISSPRFDRSKRVYVE
jgi:mannose-6-phosphate isomerase-like protein (cupin superfamily)